VLLTPQRLPEVPLWRLYLHHIQRTPWLPDATRQQLWAALSSCFYQLHAASMLTVRQGSSSSSRQQRGQQQQQPQQRQGQPTGRGAAAATGAAAAGAPQAAAAAGGSRRVLGGLSAAFGSAASAVAGAANAVAGAATAAAVAAAGAPGAPTIIVPFSDAPFAAAVAAATSGAPPGAAVKLTQKFWVRDEDVPAVMYTVLQHLPLLPSSTGHKQQPAASQAAAGAPTAAGAGKPPRPGDSSSGGRASAAQQRSRQQQRADDVSVDLQAASQPPPPPPPQQQQQQQQRPAASPGGFTTTVHTVYFDNSGLQLYHGRLYMRPNTMTLKARWIGGASDSGSGSGRGSSGSIEDAAAAAAGAAGGAAWAPSRVVLERKLYRQGWRGEALGVLMLCCCGGRDPSATAVMHAVVCSDTALALVLGLPAGAPNKKDALLIAGQQLPPYLSGSYTLAHALADLCQQPGMWQQMQDDSSAASDALSSQQQRRRQLQTPFAAPAAAWTAAAAAAGTGGSPALEGQLTAGLRMPPGAIIGSASGSRAGGGVGASAGQDGSSSGSSSMAMQGSNPNLLQLLARRRAGQIAQQQDAAGGDRRALQQQPSTMQTAPAPAPAPAAALQQQGFADAYLDPPSASADQLALFSEVQRTVGKQRLQPLLHCVLQRMLFAIPFDDRLRVTLDSNVRMRVLVSCTGRLRRRGGGGGPLLVQ
jgi:hypothetical protein